MRAPTQEQKAKEAAIIYTYLADLGIVLLTFLFAILTLSLTLIGELGRARSLCERLLSLASPLHLYAEELDSESGRHLGNFPQAFTHLSLITALAALIRAEGGDV